MSDDDTLGTAAALVELQDNDVPMHGITIVSYLDGGTGERSYSWVCHGEPTIDQTVGLLTIAQHMAIHLSDDEYAD